MNLKSKKSILNAIPPFFSFLAKHYLLGLFSFFIFRVILFLASQNHSYQIRTDFPLIKKAFLIGLQFDSVVMGYILLMPLIILAGFSFSKNRLGITISNYIIHILIFIAFFISSADIPYFLYNFSRISAVIFEWISDTGIILKMIIQEPTYLIYTGAFVLFLGFYYFISKKITHQARHSSYEAKTPKSILINLGFILISIFLIFLSLRGRIDSPIRINHAFFCNNSFYNQLGLNPNFTFIKSLKQIKNIKIIDDQVALKNVQNYFSIDSNLNTTFPIAREVFSNDSLKKKNVVLIIMESMSASKMTRNGNPNQLTPFLDSLALKSLYFNRTYSAGRHTCDGIFASLYSYPAVLRNRPMSDISQRHFSSLPEVFKNYGYFNLYFTTHSETFDNIGSFLPKNDIDSIISQKNYDPKLIQNSFGIPDHILFDYVIQTLDFKAKTPEPFFATVMTISDHGPYIIPKDIAFLPKNEAIKNQIVEYSDWSLQQFFKQASKTNWYKETLFVLVADHGAVMNESIYELPLSLHHIPLLIFSPDTTLLLPNSNDNFACQMDILPTIAGLLNFNYTNTTLGIDLTKEKRPYSFFSSDDKLACINQKYYYLYRTDGKEFLFDYSSKNPKNLIESEPKIAADMKKYVVSMTQSTNWLIAHDKTNLK